MPSLVLWTALARAGSGGIEVPYERYALANGLEVVLHQDRSDPIVAIATVVHVGSNREEPGRTGFAHFFEHMAFNDSENVPRGANRKRIEELGGQRNGGTSRDHTIYYEVVPSDALEKLLWIDSDRLGYMINTVTVPALENEKQVVKNEKRQRTDNAPYGHTGAVVSGALYPPDHPYHWQVIGSLADLQAATLDDVRAFHARWYGPNNATLVLAGDFEIEPTKKLIEQYFGEIPAGPTITDPVPRPVRLEASRSLMHVDTFAKVAEIRLTFPTVEHLHADTQALDALASLLTNGKRAPLYRSVVESGLAPSVWAWQDSAEMAGTFVIGARANPGVDLDAVRAAIQAGLADFAANGFQDADLQRYQAQAETDFVVGLESVLDRARQLARYNEFAGDPGYYAEDLERTLAVDRDAVTRVFTTWVKDQTHVTTSFVPQGAESLAVEGSERATVDEEAVVKGAEPEPFEVGEWEGERTPTTFDRSAEPPFGPAVRPVLPAVWTAEVPGGLPVRGITQTELPLVQFSVRFDGGHRHEALDQAGLAALVADLMLEGTASRTPEQLEDAIGLLGAELSAFADRDGLVLEGLCLADRAPALIELAVEVLLEPRWDLEEFERLKQERLASIAQRAGNPEAIASLLMDRRLYGEQHPYGWPSGGTEASISALTLEDLKRWRKRNLASGVASVQVVGAVDQAAALAAFEPLAAALPRRKVKTPVWPVPPEPQGPTVAFVDVPGAKQSVLQVGRLAPSARDPELHDLRILNDRLGSGGSARLFQVLRIDKGYTYGAYASFANRSGPGAFVARTSVRANVTGESMAILRDEIAGYGARFDASTLDTTRVSMSKGSALEFETLGARLSHLQLQAAFGLPADELARQQARLDAINVDRVRELAARWFDPAGLTWVVVGDAATQLAEVEAFGLTVLRFDATGAPLP
jgi:zinc protease